MFCRILYIILLAPLGIFAASESKAGGEFEGDRSAGMAAFAAARPVGAPPELVSEDAATGAFIHNTLAPTYDNYVKKFEALFSFGFLSFRDNAVEKTRAEDLRKAGTKKRVEKNFSGAEADFLEAAQLGNTASMGVLGDMYMKTENAKGATDYLASYYWYVLGAQTEYLLSGAYPESRAGKLNTLKVLGENPSADPMARIASFYAEKALTLLEGLINKRSTDFASRCYNLISFNMFAYDEEAGTIPADHLISRNACLIKRLVPLPKLWEVNLDPFPALHGAIELSTQAFSREDLRLYPHIRIQDSTIIGLLQYYKDPACFISIGNRYIEGKLGLDISSDQRKDNGLKLLVQGHIRGKFPHFLGQWSEWLIGGAIDINERGEAVAPADVFKEAMRIAWDRLACPATEKPSAYKDLIMFMLKGWSEKGNSYNAESNIMEPGAIRATIKELRSKLEAASDVSSDISLGWLYNDWAKNVLSGKIRFDYEFNVVNNSEADRIDAFRKIISMRFTLQMMMKRQELLKAGATTDSASQFYQGFDNDAINMIMDYAVHPNDIPETVKFYMFENQKRSNPHITPKGAIEIYYKKRTPKSPTELLSYAKAIAQGKVTLNAYGQEILPGELGAYVYSIYKQLLETDFHLKALHGIAELIESDRLAQDEKGNHFEATGKNRVLENIYREIYNNANAGIVEGAINEAYFKHYKMLAMGWFIDALKEDGVVEQDLEMVDINPKNRKSRLHHLLRQSIAPSRIFEYARGIYEGEIKEDEEGRPIRGYKRLAVAETIVGKIGNLGIRNYVLGRLYFTEAMEELEFLQRGEGASEFPETADKCVPMLKKAEVCFAEAMAEDVADAKDRWIGVRSEMRQMKSIIKKHKESMSQATVVVPTEDSIPGVSAAPPTVSGVAESESSDSDEEDEEEEQSEPFVSVVSSAAGGGVGVALAGAGGPSYFAGASLLGEPVSTSKAKKAPAAKPVRTNRDVLGDAEKRAQLPQTFDRWEMSKRAQKDFKKTTLELQKKILELIDTIRSDQDEGRPKYLSGDLDGWMSRRITGGGRLVYKIEKSADGRRILNIKDCKGHYDD